MMKKILFYFLVSLMLVILLFVLFFGAKKIKHYLNQPKLFPTARLLKEIISRHAESDLIFLVSNPLNKFFPHGDSTESPNLTTEITWYGAKGEYESAQIILPPRERALTGLHFLTSDLHSRDGQGSISSSNISIKEIAFVKTQQPYYPTKWVGFWPDPLKPLTNDLHTESQQLKAFWITLYIPPDTIPGDYVGQIIIETDNKMKAICPIMIHVWPFKLSKEASLKTAFDFYGHLTHVHYPQANNESDLDYQYRLDGINDQFIRMMLNYRMNPILNIDPAQDQDLAKVDRYRVMGLNHFSIGRFGGTFDNNWPRDNAAINQMGETYQTYGELLKLNQFLSFTYIYVWDEKDMGNPWVKSITQMIHRAYPELKTMVCFHGLWDPDILPHWGDDIDIWTFHIDHYDPKIIDKMRARGMEMWMYVSGPSSTTSPNLSMDFDAIDSRIIPWMSWKFDWRGFLYWCVNWWGKKDPLLDAKTTDWDQNGNGFLFYPGPDGPWPSLRAENFRDGMEDYEYIQILIGVLRELKAKEMSAKEKAFYNESIAVLTIEDDFISTPFQFNRDSKVLFSKRLAIAKKIEEFYQKLW